MHNISHVWFHSFAKSPLNYMKMDFKQVRAFIKQTFLNTRHNGRVQLWVEKCVSRRNAKGLFLFHPFAMSLM